LLKDVARSLWHPAKQHAAHTLYLLQTVPGIGKLLSVGLLYEIHESDRLPRVQAFVFYGRLVTCAKASAGQRLGTSGKKLGMAISRGPLPQRRRWACATLLCTPRDA
jgi:hypothetical protein